MDEARVENVVRSSNWIWAAWLNSASNSMFATTSSITRQQPLLSLNPGGANLSLTWPATGVGFTLYTATNLAPPVNWAAATNQPLFTNSQWQITLPAAASGSRFYRLQQ
jgi:hypothetical protein